MKQLTQAEISMPCKPAPMTLGNMRANGVQTLAVWPTASHLDPSLDIAELYSDQDRGTREPLARVLARVYRPLRGGMKWG
jgi:hypothetical protein